MRKTTKKLLSLILAGSMVFSLAACGKEGKTTETNAGTDPTKAPDTATTAPVDNGGSTTKGGRAEYDSEGRRIIKVGTWYDHYYTSDHDAIEDNPDVTDVEAAQMQLDNMRAIEEKYNVKFQFVNLTWAGVLTFPSCPVNQMLISMKLIFSSVFQQL